MSTIGWILILLAALLLRGVSKGRVMELPTDLRDMLVAGLRGDVEAVKEVAGRTGTGLTLETVQPGSDAVSDGVTNISSNTLVTEARRLGTAAHNRYQWGAEGPDAYDCSGLVWRVLVNQLGAKKVGSRFTTSTFAKASTRWAQRVSSPQPGDIVVWDRGASGHMGFVVGANRMYSALSSRTGIVESSISSESGTPAYYRVTG